MKYSKSQLTPAKKKFAQVYSETDNATEAVRQAYPELAPKTTNEVIRNKGYTLLTNPHIQAEISLRKQVMSQNADRAAHKIKELIESDKEEIALKASIFSYEQEEGKSLQKIEQTTTGVTLTIDLTSALIGVATDKDNIVRHSDSASSPAQTPQ